MRVFLVQTAQGLTPSSGGYKANVNLLRTLGRQGHTTAQICYAVDEEVIEYKARAEAKGINPDVTSEFVPVVDLVGLAFDVPVTTFTDEDNINNVVFARREFNAAYPVREF